MSAASRTFISAGVGGLLSGAVAHVITALFDRAGSGTWLQGRYGPPFFNVALFMGVMYTGIAWALLPRRRDVLIGALPFFAIALPLAVLERVSDLPWTTVVVLVFIAAVWGTIAAIGWRIGGWRSAFGAIGGSFCGYLVLMGITAATPALNNWPLALYKYLPTPLVLLDGLLTGAGLGIGAQLLRRNNA